MARAPIRLDDRQREVAFGLGLLLPVALLLALGEIAARLYLADVREVGTDWRALIEAVGIEEPTYVRFRPGSAAGELSFNDHGFRGPDLPVPAPPRTVRVAVLGDSKVLSASLPEADTLPAQTAARLAGARPDCRIDWVSIAGPGYTMDTLATLWAGHAPALRPDLAVVLAGSAGEVVARHDAGVPPGRRIRQGAGAAVDEEAGTDPAAAPGLAGRSALLAVLRRNLLLLSPAAPAIGPEALPWDELDRAYRDMSRGLVEALDGVPVIALGYRSRVRPGQDPATQAEATRSLRAEIPGLSVGAAVALSEFVPDALRAVAAEAGWTYLDPIRDIPGDDAAFIDATHLSAAGLGRIADALAARVASDLDAACRL